MATIPPRYARRRLPLLVGVLVGLLVAGVPALAIGPDVSRLGTPGDLVCDGLDLLAVAEVELCTHGPDVAPAVAAAGNSPGAPVPRRAVHCVGNGVEGQRVEVLYVHDTSSGAASSSRRSQITGWVEQVEWTVQASAARFGGDRRVRWRTDSCSVRISSVAVSSSAMRDFGRMIDELRDRGWSRSDRTYLLFVDSTTYCGIATAPRDDSRAANRADGVAGYARVDRNCWDAGDEGYHSIAAHELIHTLGAVQATAPNATSGAHCTDEHDLLCYDDGTGGRIRIVCKDGDSRTEGAGDANDRLFDCRGDDYFHPSPPAGSYLATHWNTADSARLHDPTAPTPPTGGGGSGGGGGDGTDRPPSPFSDPVGYALYLIFG